MYMKEFRSPIIALTGPSGAGKSFLTDKIMSRWPDKFERPIIATTRPARANMHEPHRSCMTEDEFSLAVSVGAVVLPHRPFSGIDTPRYGFLGQTLSGESPLLTEVHVSLLAPFRELVKVRPVLTIGMVVSLDVLAANITSRQDGAGDDMYETRLSMAANEMHAIIAANQAGIIDMLVGYDPHQRTHSEAAVLTAVEHHLMEGNT